VADGNSIDSDCVSTTRRIFVIRNKYELVKVASCPTTFIVLNHLVAPLAKTYC
jgi:hypothetical protein